MSCEKKAKLIKNGFYPILSLSDFLHLGKQWMVIWASGPLRVNCALETSQMELGALAGGTNHGLFN